MQGSYQQRQLKQAQKEVSKFIKDLPKLQIGATIFAAIHWLILVNMKLNKKNSCYQTITYFQYALTLIGIKLKYEPLELDQFQEIPQQYQFLQNVPVFGFTLISKDVQVFSKTVICGSNRSQDIQITEKKLVQFGDHYIAFIKIEDGSHVLIHSWENQFSLQDWVNMADLRAVGKRKLNKAFVQTVPPPWKNPIINAFSFMHRWQEYVQQQNPNSQHPLIKQKLGFLRQMLYKNKVISVFYSA